MSAIGALSAEQPKAEQMKTEGERAERERIEFDAALGAVEKGAREWGVRHELPEGRFVSALLAAIRMTGWLSAASHNRLVKAIESNRDGAELELARAREVTRAASLAMTQARNAQIALQVEQETVVARMIDRVLPLFAERMQKVLTVREKRVNVDIILQRYVMVALATLGFFLGGYLVRLTQDSVATALLDRCLVQPVQSAGAFWCDITNVIPVAPPAAPKQQARPAK